MKPKNLKETYTKYEKARIIGARALQLSQGAPLTIKLSKEELKRINYDFLEIAKLEFEKGTIPITVKRPLLQKKKSKQEWEE